MTDRHHPASENARRAGARRTALLLAAAAVAVYALFLYSAAQR